MLAVVAEMADGLAGFGIESRSGFPLGLKWRNTSAVELPRPLQANHKHEQSGPIGPVLAAGWW